MKIHYSEILHSCWVYSSDRAECCDWLQMVPLSNHVWNASLLCTQKSLYGETGIFQKMEAWKTSVHQMLTSRYCSWRIVLILSLEACIILLPDVFTSIVRLQWQHLNFCGITGQFLLIQSLFESFAFMEIKLFSSLVFPSFLIVSHCMIYDCLLYLCAICRLLIDYPSASWSSVTVWAFEVHKWAKGSKHEIRRKIISYWGYANWIIKQKQEHEWTGDKVWGNINCGECNLLSRSVLPFAFTGFPLNHHYSWQFHLTKFSSLKDTVMKIAFSLLWLLTFHLSVLSEWWLSSPVVGSRCLMATALECSPMFVGGFSEA